MVVAAGAAAGAGESWAVTAEATSSMAKLAAIDSGRIIGLFRVVVRMDAGIRASALFEYSGECPRVHIPACRRPQPAARLAYRNA